MIEKSSRSMQAIWKTATRKPACRRLGNPFFITKKTVIYCIFKVYSWSQRKTANRAGDTTALAPYSNCAFRAQLLAAKTAYAVIFIDFYLFSTFGQRFGRTNLDTL